MKSLIKIICVVCICFLSLSCERKENDLSPFSIEITSVKTAKGAIQCRAKSNYVASTIEKGFCISTSSNPSLSDVVYVADKSDLSEFVIYESSYYFYKGYEWRYEDDIYSVRRYDCGDFLDFSITIKDLHAGTKYYVCAYAKSKHDVVYSNVKSFIMK